MCDCVFCKRGEMSVATVNPSCIEIPARSIREVVSSLVEVGVVGRVVLAIILNGRDMTDRQEELVFWYDRLKIISLVN